MSWSDEVTAHLLAYSKRMEDAKPVRFIKMQDGDAEGWLVENSFFDRYLPDWIPPFHGWGAETITIAEFPRPTQEQKRAVDEYLFRKIKPEGVQK